MALQRKQLTEIPTDAVVLSELQATDYQMRILNNWTPQSDIFGYKYGTALLGAATMFTGMFINNFFRIKFKLLKYGWISSYLPMCIVPSTLSCLYHQQFVLRDVVLMKHDQCPICLQTRAAAFQAFLGCGLPVLLAPVTSLALVHKYNTYNMPYVTKEPLKVFKVLQSKFTPIKNTLFWIFLGQALLGSLVTYWETGSVHKVYSKLYAIEKQMEEEQF
ncbi:unnamed protein product [Phaedon cochleariae]|uniref:Uncharacterized protein n=1 Tax=Phaedon cochleariae TaxID=80249 RepID=A0A9N9SKN8_PHACE|nr:unnamed protein product [Phaedon cochleariae]